MVELLPSDVEKKLVMKKHQNTLTTLIALAVLLAVSLGCRAITDRLQQNESDVSDVSSGPSYPTPEGDTKPPAGGEDASVAKSNLYISKCVNAYSNSVMGSYQRYTSWLRDPKAGPTGKESIVYGLYEVRGDGSDCAAAIAEAKESEPDMPELEAAADRYVTALKEAASQVRNVYEYYDQEDYKDDNFEKGKAAHQPLMAAFEAFRTANEAFTVEVDKLEDQVAQNRLEQYRSDPTKKFEFAAADFSIKAKKAMNYAARTQFNALAADTLQSHTEDLETALSTLRANTPQNGMGGMFADGGEKFVKAVKELMRRVREKKPFNSTERGWVGTSAGWMVEGSPDKVVHEYNNMIRSRTFMRM